MHGRAGIPGPDDPLPPKRYGPFEIIASGIRRRCRHRPLAIVVRGVCLWTRDSIDLLLYLARRVERERVSILIDAAGLDDAPHWVAPLRMLDSDIGLRKDFSLPPGSDIGPTEPTGAAEEFASLGAIHAAPAALRFGGDTWSEARVAAQLCLLDGDDGGLRAATERMLWMAPDGRRGALAWRMRLLAMHWAEERTAALATRLPMRACHAHSDMPTGNGARITGH